ncbi:hypothetical protein [Synechococcus elongatus]|uniref:Uncharacterized protein n=1 Tax=Synechococcus elongatus (strain ATCC 33912 / PCC 7942 / FACHB-805) TaxID=1140 RepID=Q31NR0_SYNE7|nr:hypothetical protein [Synechococcus elongatus]ABB57309.1 hypothetical protein Synpcc7942_1279 [Synechococcus elongatus PCC 7942 = FACHB-805]AJD58899.1 hypothetical protein M744_10235 [Synechococcus elongatus UTEX 2973]MBD2587716.1 hypothetical protein [Synechococcus elongatus FACHB-242]MBD2688505.1 hypothetical protein [Synechococcus elongatus FACHB-1061]MBD2707576.1 hypothetical protein [Synechococcus elongatus PCC 7942 = FACHB-805]
MSDRTLTRLYSSLQAGEDNLILAWLVRIGQPLSFGGVESLNPLAKTSFFDRDDVVAGKQAASESIASDKDSDVVALDQALTLR